MVASLAENSVTSNGQPVPLDLDFFKVGEAGVPVAIAGVAYMVAMAPRWLPVRESVAARFQSTYQAGFVMPMVVVAGSALVGRTVKAAGVAQQAAGVELLRVARRQVGDTASDGSVGGSGGGGASGSVQWLTASAQRRKSRSPQGYGAAVGAGAGGTSADNVEAGFAAASHSSSGSDGDEGGAAAGTDEMQSVEELDAWVLAEGDVLEFVCRGATSAPSALFNTEGLAPLAVTQVSVCGAA